MSERLFIQLSLDGDRDGDYDTDTDGNYDTDSEGSSDGSDADVDNDD